MQKEYIEKIARKWGLEITYSGSDHATFTLINQKSDSVQLMITNDDVYPSIIINGQDIGRTQKQYSFENMREAIKSLSVFSDYYNLVVSENFKQF
jgi:hypothetical protein